MLIKVLGLSFLCCCLNIVGLKTKKLNLKTTIHEFHTSITEIKANTKEQIFEISIRVFTDDLEMTLAKKNKLKLVKIINGDKNDGLVQKYINQKFGLKNNAGKIIPISYIGKENEDLATWIYVQVPLKAVSSKVTLSQTILLDEFTDQINIVNILDLNQKSSFIFDQKNQSKIYVR